MQYGKFSSFFGNSYREIPNKNENDYPFINLIRRPFGLAANIYFREPNIHVEF